MNINDTVKYIDTALTGEIVEGRRRDQVIDMIARQLQSISERVAVLEDCQEGTDNLLDQMNKEENHMVVTEHPEMKENNKNG